MITATKLIIIFKNMGWVRNARRKTVPVVVGATEAIPNWYILHLALMKGNKSFKTIQKSWLLGEAHVLSSVAPLNGILWILAKDHSTY